MNRQELLQTFALASEFKGSEPDGGVEDNRVHIDARRRLGKLRLGEMARISDPEDGLSEVLAQSVHKLLSRELASLTVETVKQLLISSSADLWWQRYCDGLSSEAIAAIVKIMTNDELASVAKHFFNPLTGLPRDAVVKIGSPGHLGSQLRANSPRDDEQEVLFSILEGLSYGCGDVLLSIKPANDDVETVSRLGQFLSRTIELLKLPTRFSVMTDLIGSLSANSRLKTNVAFLRLAGTSNVLKSLNEMSEKEFVELACNSGDLFFQTGQMVKLNDDTANQPDQAIIESRAFGLASAIRQQIESRQNQSPWIIINSLIGLNDQEVFFTSGQMLRVCLEKTVMAKLHGLTVGLDVNLTFHSGVSSAELRQLTACIAEQASPAFLSATAGNADPLFGYLTTSFREHPRLRRAFGKQITSAMQQRLTELGATNPKGEPAAHALTTARLYAEYRRAGGDTRSAESLLAEGLKMLEQMKQRGFDLGYGHIGDYVTPKEVERRLENICNQSRRGFHALPH